MEEDLEELSAVITAQGGVITFLIGILRAKGVLEEAELRAMFSAAIDQVQAVPALSQRGRDLAQITLEGMAEAHGFGPS